MAIIFVLTIFAGQLLRVQAFDASATQAAALNKRSFLSAQPALRGSILDSQGRILAESVERYRIEAYPPADPTYTVKIEGQKVSLGPDGAAAKLAPLLGVDQTKLAQQLGGKKNVILKKNVSPEEWTAVRGLGLPGINGIRTSSRTYPSGMAAGALVGFVQPSDQSPSQGVELMLNKTLAGKPGKTVAEIAPNGTTIPGSVQISEPVVNGRDVQLTIDADLQFMAQNALAKQVTAVGAKSGTAVVIEVKTGKIKAAASYPSFDPNDLSTAAKGSSVEQTFTQGFEPGSTAKLMTMAAAMEEKVVTPDTGVIVPNRLPRAGQNFKDNENHPTENLTATGVIGKSSNIGTILIGERVEPAVMEKYFRAFGIGSTTGSGFPNENPGLLAKSTKWNAPQRYTVLFGQGFNLTSVQAVSVFATIANGGVRMPPRLVEATANESGTMVPTPAVTGTRVVSTDTATKLSRMLEEVTGKDGTARDARIAGYRVAGKTGTADRYDEKIRKYNGFTASFIGYAPAESPKYVVGVFIQDPKAGMFGGALAGPVFNQIMTYLIELENVAPSTPSTLNYHVWAKTPLSDSDPKVLSNAQAKRDGL